MRKASNRKFQRKDWNLLMHFGHYFRPHKKWFIISMISIPITAAAGIVFLWLIQNIIDNYIVPKNFDGLQYQILYLALVLLVNFIFDGMYSYSFSRSGGLAIADMRQHLFGKALRFPLSYFDKNPIGITLSRLTSDMESISDSFSAGILGLLADSIKTISLLVYLFILNWQLSLMLMIVVPIIVICLSYLRKKIRGAYNISRSSLAKSAAYLQESLNGMKTIQLYAAEKEAFHKYDQLNKEFCDAQNHSNIYDSSMYSVVEGITSLATALILWYGAIQIWDNGYTIGILIVFVTTLERLFVPIKQFAQQISTIQRALSALEHISELFKQPVEDEEQFKKEQHYPAVKIKEIEFKNVYFKYNPDSPDVLKNVSFKLTKGERIALVGTTGSGKSTIIRLLSGTYKGYRGSITINGKELSDYPLAQIRSTISVMQQDIFLFNESIRFNIGLNRPEITDKQIEQAASFVYANHFINKLPGQFDYIVQDNGDNLSKGQAQLISFARAICGNNDLIILDEATSSVDSVTEQYIQKAIENIFSARTVIAVAHRLSTIKHSDLILVLEDGEVIERGNHQSLIAHKGKYASLVNQLNADHSEQ